MTLWTTDLTACTLTATMCLSHSVIREAHGPAPTARRPRRAASRGPRRLLRWRGLLRHRHAVQPVPGPHGAAVDQGGDRRVRLARTARDAGARSQPVVVGLRVRLGADHRPVRGRGPRPADRGARGRLDRPREGRPPAAVRRVVADHAAFDVLRRAHRGARRLRPTQALPDAASARRWTNEEELWNSLAPVWRQDHPTDRSRATGSLSSRACPPTLARRRRPPVGRGRHRQRRGSLYNWIGAVFASVATVRPYSPRLRCSSSKLRADGSG